MSDILTVYDWLSSALTMDVQTCLAYAVTLFDPGCDYEDDDTDLDSDMLVFAVQMTRTSFPDVYAEVVEVLQRDGSASELDVTICNGITAYGLPLEDIEAIGWGIPISGSGIRFEDPECLQNYPQIAVLLDLFKIDLDAEELDLAIPSAAASLLMHDLIQQEDECWQQIGWALAWVFSCSGNSSVDYDDEALADFNPLDWEQNNIAFAIELIREAKEVLSSAQEGLQLLEQSPSIRQILKRNIAKANRHIRKHGRKADAHPANFCWTAPDGSPE